MPAWMEYVMHVDVARFARFAAKVFDVQSGNPAAMAEEGIRRYRTWLRALKMPVTFAELGAREEDIPALVAKLGLGDGRLGSFMPLSSDDVANIFRLCCR